MTAPKDRYYCGDCPNLRNHDRGERMPYLNCTLYQCQLMETPEGRVWRCAECWRQEEEK